MRVHHVALRTLDVEGLVAFYQHHLGLVVAHRTERSVWLALEGPAMLMIEAREAGEPPPDARSMELLAFSVDEATREALRSRLLVEGRLEGVTAHTLYFRDPEGRRIGVSTHPLTVSA